MTFTLPNGTHAPHALVCVHVCVWLALSGCFMHTLALLSLTFFCFYMDRLAGMLSVVAYLGMRRSRKGRRHLPALFRNPTPRETPWRFPRLAVSQNLLPGPKVTSIVAFVVLLKAYFWTGRLSLFWEDVFYAMAGTGFPMTIAMHRSLSVLMGHLTWVGMGGLILGLIPRPQPFFGGGYVLVQEEKDNKDDDDDYDNSLVQRRPSLFKWFTSTWDTYWLGWVLGGYFVSSWVFNVSDMINQYVLPPSVFLDTTEGVVQQLINPENNDWWASLVGFAAPCWSAPWWEEVLYRGFMLPAMCCHMSFPLAVWLQGCVFSFHHMSTIGALPLAMLGWTWAILYTKSGNLLVTILIHAMWNSRVFIGNWLGL